MDKVPRRAHNTTHNTFGTSDAASCRLSAPNKRLYCGALSPRATSLCPFSGQRCQLAFCLLLAGGEPFCLSASCVYPPSCMQHQAASVSSDMRCSREIVLANPLPCPHSSMRAAAHGLVAGAARKCDKSAGVWDSLVFRRGTPDSCAKHAPAALLLLPPCPFAAGLRQSGGQSFA